eukprot:SAG31_NODE_63_length_28659_cov_23.074685_25_plen_50_part_00
MGAIYLEQVGEIDEQMWRLLAPAYDVKTGSADIFCLATLHEVMLHSQSK